MRARIFAAAGVMCACTMASGQIISGVTATSSLPDAFTTTLELTLDGSGLPGGVPALVGEHESSGPGNSWVTDGSLPGEITFNLNGSYLVGGFSFWNQNDGGPGLGGTSGINDVAIEFSDDGVLYSPLAGAPSNFAIVPTGFSPPEVFSFGAVTATHIRINVRSNHGSAFTAYGEIHFRQVPAPATFAVLAAGSLVGLRRRRTS